ncbi:hypothetical protein ACKVMT_00150 [Halobacteriales archaeon Cl-PHB]
MQCEACGATIPNDVDSCPQCGAALSATSETAPASGRGRSAAGGGQRAQDDGGQAGHPPAGRAAEGGGRTAGGGGQPQQQGPQGQPRQAPGSGEDLLTRTGKLLDRLPWRAGMVAGGLLYGFLFALFAAPAVYFEVERGLEIALTVFLGLVSFVSLSDIALTVGTMAGESVPAELASGQYDALAGVGMVVAPYLLYASGKRFAQWNYADPDDVVVGYLGAGAAVVFGTVPFVALVTFLFGGDLVNETLMAGLLIPGLIGAFGGTMAWTFRGRSRAASWGSGIVTGIVGVVLLLGLTSMWAQSGAGLVDGGSMAMSRFVAAIVVFVSVVTFGFSASGSGLLAYVAVALPLAGLGYFRVTRSNDPIDEPLEGARTGASLVAGFSTFAFVLLALYTFWNTPAGAEMLADANAVPQLFLPESASAIAQITTLDDFLNAFAFAVLVFPLVVGGLGGALASYRLRKKAAAPHQPAAGRGSQQPQHQVKGQRETQTRAQPSDAAAGSQQGAQSARGGTGESAPADRQDADQ